MNEDDECANQIADSLRSIAHAITPLNAMPGQDETGGSIASLTEAVMGVTAALVKISDSIDYLAGAVSDLKDEQ